MLLALDLGNTSADAALFTWRRNAPHLRSARKWPIKRIERLPSLWRAWPAAIRLGPPTAVAIASVNPAALRSAERTVRRLFRMAPVVLGRDLPFPVKIRIRRPEQVGADRLAASLAAHHRAPRGRPAIVVDFGTAISFDVVSARGEFLGGVIAASPAVAARGLHESCALLPLIEPRPVRSPIGQDTAHAIRSALHFGTPGLVCAILDALRRELRGRPCVIATGGAARHWAPRLPGIDAVVPHLVLEGIARGWRAATRM
ncbi:MAG: type III pantothenate kinase [Planctomycetes bacterium]|nr:type III pantothenate kinase [Planctomycetota bacterium]